MAPHATNSLGTELTDGEWWAKERGIAILVQLERGHGGGVIAKAAGTSTFSIGLREFEFVGAKAQFTIEHEGGPSTWVAVLDVGDVGAPAPTDDQLEAERYEVFPMTIVEVHGRLCAEMTPFKLWRKYPGGEAQEVDRLRRLVAERPDAAHHR